MESQLLELDLAQPDEEEINAIFRAAHSIKGGAATFGFTDMADVTHVLETLLDRVRRGELVMTTPMVDAALAAGDVLKTLLAAHRGQGAADVGAIGDVCERLRMLASGDGERLSRRPLSGNGRDRAAPISASLSPLTPPRIREAAGQPACRTVRYGRDHGCGTAGAGSAGGALGASLRGRRHEQLRRVLDLFNSRAARST